MKKKSDLPPDFTVSKRVENWAKLHNYTQLDEHLEHFILTCQAHGYQYVNHDSAFMCAVRSDWAGLRKVKRVNGHSTTLEAGMALGIDPRPGESMQDYERRVANARH